MSGKLKQFWRVVILVCTSLASVHTVLSAQENNQQKMDISSQIGWIDNKCIAIKNAHIKKGTVISIVSLDTEQEILSGTIQDKTEKGSHCPALLEDRKAVNTADGYSFYTVQTTSQLELAIGLLNKQTKLKKANKIVVADVNGDGKQDVFTLCASSEGLHFDIWTEKPYAGEPIWSGYYYLAYDIEPNCPQ